MSSRNLGGITEKTPEGKEIIKVAKKMCGYASKNAFSSEAFMLVITRKSETVINFDIVMDSGVEHCFDYLVDIGKVQDGTTASNSFASYFINLIKKVPIFEMVTGIKIMADSETNTTLFTEPSGVPGEVLVYIFNLHI